MITVAGQCMHVLTAPEDVQSLYKHTGSLSWVRFVQDLYRWIGISPYNINKLWQAPTERQKHSNPIPKLPPNEIIEEYQFRQLLLGEKVDKLTQIFVDYRGKTICWQHLETKPTYVLEKSSGSIRMSLMDWTAQVFLHTTTEVYWGKTIFEIAPRLTQSYLKCEETKWKYVFQLPYCVNKDMYAARYQLIDTFTLYYRRPKEQRADVVPYVTAAEEELRDLSFNDHDVAKINMLQLWA